MTADSLFDQPSMPQQSGAEGVIPQWVAGRTAIHRRAACVEIRSFCARGHGASVKSLPSSLLPKLVKQQSEIRHADYGQLHGRFFTDFGRSLLKAEVLNANSVAQVVLVLCAVAIDDARRAVKAKNPASRRRWQDQTREGLWTLAGVSRAAWYRAIQHLAQAGIVIRRTDEQTRIRINRPLFAVLSERSTGKETKEKKDFSKRFGQFYAALTDRIIKDKWVAKNPSGSRILLVMIAALAMEERKAKVLYWLRMTREDFCALVPMGPGLFKKGTTELTKGNRPLVIRHPKDRCIYTVAPNFFCRAAAASIPDKELARIPPPTRIISLKT